MREILPSWGCWYHAFAADVSQLSAATCSRGADDEVVVRGQKTRNGHLDKSVRLTVRLFLLTVRLFYLDV